jgi:hypothetical protein
MKYLLLLLSTFCFHNFSVFSQETLKTDSIQYYSTVLSGVWEYKGMLQDGVYQDSTSSCSTDGVTTIEVLNDSGYLVYTYRNDSLLSKSFSRKVKVLKLNFASHPCIFDEFFISSVDSSRLSYESCSPVSNLEVKNGEYIMILTGLVGEEEIKFTFSGSTLYLESFSHKSKYIRFSEIE